MTAISAKTIVFVVFDHVKLLDLSGPMQVFADTVDVSDTGYDLVVASRGGGPVASDVGLPVATVALSDIEGRAIDTLVIAGGAGAFAAARDPALVGAVQRIAKRCRRIGSVCTGAFVLAAAGLLSGRRAVTHWRSCDQLRDSYADITVMPDAIYVQDGAVWTSAGVTAGIDMCLAMVAQDLGRKTALALARELVCYMVRPGGQAQFSTPLQHQSNSAGGRFDALNGWIMDNLATPLTVDRLAAHAAMSPRNFARLYKADTGVPPAKAVEQMRVAAACRLLETTDMPLARIVGHCGFADCEHLRRAMMRSVHVAPAEYRQRFGIKA